MGTFRPFDFDRTVAEAEAGHRHAVGRTVAIVVVGMSRLAPRHQTKHWLWVHVDLGGGGRRRGQPAVIQARQLLAKALHDLRDMGMRDGWSQQKPAAQSLRKIQRDRPDQSGGGVDVDRRLGIQRRCALDDEQRSNAVPGDLTPRDATVPRLAPLQRRTAVIAPERPPRRDDLFQDISRIGASAERIAGPKLAGQPDKDVDVGTKVIFRSTVDRKFVQGWLRHLAAELAGLQDLNGYQRHIHCRGYHPLPPRAAGSRATAV
ncbi:hypothetical protein ACVWW1_002795 [Bradyrhizobium sp. JR3.5]